MARRLTCADDLPCDPYDGMEVQKSAVHTEGDVAARVAVRFDEVTESTGIIQRILSQLPIGLHHVGPTMPNEGALGIGMGSNEDGAARYFSRLKPAIAE